MAASCQEDHLLLPEVTVSVKSAVPPPGQLLLHTNGIPCIFDGGYYENEARESPLGPKVFTVIAEAISLSQKLQKNSNFCNEALWWQNRQFGKPFFSFSSSDGSVIETDNPAQAANIFWKRENVRMTNIIKGLIESLQKVISYNNLNEQQRKDVDTFIARYENQAKKPKHTQEDLKDLFHRLAPMVFNMGNNVKIIDPVEAAYSKRIPKPF